MAAIKLKDLLEGQQRLAQRENMPLEQSEDKLQKLVDAISQKASPAVNLNSNQKIFEDFVKQTQKREELLKDATAEQIVIFKHLEDTIKKLKDASHADSLDLRKVIENLANKLKVTPATGAKTNMMKALTAPAAAARPKPNAAVLSPTDYKLYEDSASVGDTDDSRTSMGEADAKSKDKDGLGLLDLLGAGLMGRGLKSLIAPAGKSKGAAQPLSAAERSKRATDVGGFKKDAQGRFRNAKGQLVKTPGLMTRGLDTLRGPAKVLGKVATKIPLVGGILAGGIDANEEYEKSGDMKKAATVGTASAAGSMGGAVAGAAAGAVIGSVVPVVGTAIGGVIGAIAGGYLGSKVGKTLGGAGYDIATTPALTAKSASEIRDITMKNQDITMAQDTAPVVINNNTTAAPVMPQQTYIPRGDVRPSESALERYIDRSFSR
jgi:phage tail tape-measure protein